MKKDNNELQGFSDSDQVGFVDNTKSTGGFCFLFGSVVFSWNLKKQEIFAQSSVEAEYIAIVATTKNVQWLRKILTDLGFVQSKGTVLHVDNQSTIAIARNPVHH